jgi:hypothetical protein
VRTTLADMRVAIVRLWTSVAVAVVTGAVADAGTEFAENLGWLGGSVRDAQHQAVMPTLLIGLAIGAALAAFVAFAGIAPRDPLFRYMSGWRAPAIDLAVALAGSELCAIAMEGYETRFGGLSPFDPRSVLCAHAPALLIAFVLIAAIARGITKVTLEAARRAGELATNAVVEFLHRAPRARVAAAIVHTSAYMLRVAHLPAAVDEGVLGFRAPPRSLLSGYFVT